MTSMTGRLLAEFLGTFLLMVVIGANSITQTGLWGVISNASMLMVLIYAFGSISGANFNPAVSFMLGVLKLMGGRGMVCREVCLYCIVQVFGSIMGAFFYFYMFETAITLPIPKSILDLGICETVYSFMLCFVVLNVSVVKDKSPNEYFGLAIALVLIASVGSAATGGSLLNPAIAIGIDVSAAVLGGSLASFGSCFTHILFELVGAVSAVIIFKFIRPCNFDVEPTVVSLAPKLWSEATGSFIIVFTYGMSVLGRSPATPLSMAAAYTSMMYSLSDVSGGHFNPAITLAAFISKMFPMSPKTVGYYLLAQICGGILGAFTYGYIFSDDLFDHVGFIPAMRLKVALAEVLFTFVICLVLLAVCFDERTKCDNLYGVIVGGCIVAGGFAVERISGGLFNPAIVISMATHGWAKGYLYYKDLSYVFYQLLGGALAASFLKVTHQRESIDDESKQFR